MSELITMPRLLLFIGGFLSIYLYGYMHRTFYEMRPWAENKKYIVVLIYGLTWIGVFAANMMEIPMLNLISSISSYFIPLFLCYQVKNIRGFIYYGFYFAGIIVIEILIGISAGRLTNGMGMKAQYDILTPQVSVIINLMELILVLMICKFGSKEKEEHFDRITLLIMVMPLISVALMIGDTVRLSLGHMENFNPEQLMRTTILILIVNIAVFFILEKYTILMRHDMELVQEKLKAESDANLMEVAAKAMKERLHTAEEVMRQDRLMRHDRRHFEALMLGLLQDNKVEDAKKCLEERLAMEPKTVQRYCDNTTVNAAINHYVSWAEKEEIDTRILANIPENLSVDDMDLSITISNLLENAIHACQKLPVSERYIHLTAKYKNQLLLEVENSCDGNILFDEDGYPYTQEEGHGIGTKSVIAFASKTDSEVSYLLQNKKFIVRMIIG